MLLGNNIFTLSCSKYQNFFQKCPASCKAVDTGLDLCNSQVAQVIYSRVLEDGIDSLESALLFPHQLFPCGTWEDPRTHNSMQRYLSLLVLFKQLLKVPYPFKNNSTISYYDYWYFLLYIHIIWDNDAICKLRIEISSDSEKPYIRSRIQLDWLLI